MFNTTRQNRFKVGLYAALFSITTMGSSQLLGQNQDIQTLLEPARSSQVLAWENISSQNVVRWRVDILKKEIQNGITSYIPQIQFFQDKSYLGIDKQYMNENYYYKVYGLDAGDNVIVTGDGPNPVQPGVTTDKICDQKCRGSNYAYMIEQFTEMYNGQQNGSYLTAGQAFAWTDPITGMVTPYFQYIGQTAWNNLSIPPSTNPWVGKGLKIIHFKKSVVGVGTVMTAQNTGIAEDDIVGIENRMGSIESNGGNKFEMLSNKKTNTLSTQLPCDPQLSDFTLTFNTFNSLVFPTQTDPSVPTLVCNADPNEFLMSNSGSLFNSDPTQGDDDLPDALDGFGYYYRWYYNGYWDDVETGNGIKGTNKGVLSFEELNEELETKSNPNYTDGMMPADYIQFEFQLVGDPNSSIVYYPSDITQEDGSMSFSSINLPSGLYSMTVIHSDLVIYSIYFESLGGEGMLNNTLSNYLNTNIYQVPILDYKYNVNLTSSKNMMVLYQVFDFDGNLLLEEEFELLDGEEIIYHAEINQGQNYSNNILINKFTCIEDGSSITTQTLISTN